MTQGAKQKIRQKCYARPEASGSTQRVANRFGGGDVRIDLLGHERVLDYDGSRTEWGDSARGPIER